MDPKLSSLDPKLQDAYNRVMGTTPAAPGPQTQAPQASVTPPPAAQAPDPALPPYPQAPAQADISSSGFQTPSPVDQAPQAPVYSAPIPVAESAPPPPPIAENAYSTPVTTPPPVPAEPTPAQSAPVQEYTQPAQPQMAPIETSSPAIPSAPSGSIPGVNSTLSFNATDSQKNVGTTPRKKGGLHIMPVVIGLGIVVLLVAYTFAWIILFNVEIPFL